MKFSKKLVACVAVMMLACMMLAACGTPSGATVNNVVKAVDGYAEERSAPLFGQHSLISVLIL